MATGLDTKFSSDHLNESKSACCSPCSENGINSKARHYCVDCVLYFCSKCVQCHNIIPTSKSHQLNDVDVSSWTTDSDVENGDESLSNQMLKCNLHQDRLIDTYCKDHDEVCCATCAVVKHRSCATTPISFAAERFKSNPEVHECRGNLKNALQKFKQEKTKRTKNIDSISKQKIELIDTIDKYEEIIIAKIKKLANNSRNEVRSKYEKDKEALDKDIEAMDALITTTTAYVGKLEQTDDDLLFVNVKTSNIVMKDGEALVQAMMKDWNERELKLFLNKTLEITVDEMASLGHLEDDLAVRGYKSTFQSKVSDQMCVYDMCRTDSGDLLLIDYKNESLKRYNAYLEYKDEIKLPGGPIALCTIEQHEVGVRTWGSDVHIVSLGQTMQFKSKFTLNGYGYGMTYESGEIFACEEDKVNVYNKTGKHLRTYNKDVNGEQMFSACRQIAISINKDIYVTNNKQGLIVFDKTGRLKMKVNSFENNNIWALCLLPGNVCLVFSESSDAIYQIDKDGKEIKKKIDVIDGSKNKYCAVYENETSRLIVAGYPNKVSIQTLQPNKE